ncbi:hypothetical protein [Bacillus cihuensis]|nr:hypothetical protein [Bacillus cihuensis]
MITTRKSDYLDCIIAEVSKAGIKGVDVQIALLEEYKNSNSQE